MNHIKCSFYMPYLAENDGQTRVFYLKFLEQLPGRVFDN